MDDIIGVGLRAQLPAIAYEVRRAIFGAYADRSILETPDELEILDFARAGHAQATSVADATNQILTMWTGPEHGLVDRAENAWVDVTFEGHDIRALRMTWPTAYAKESRWWLACTEPTVLRKFLAQVAAWSADVHGEILVFQDGCFSKSASLFHDVKSASWAQLILAGEQKDEIRSDFDRFFASKDTYATFGVPWRRGALFLGPPGNGKTHCVKALVNHLARPTIYVRGFRHRYRTTSDCIADVFRRARQIAPCLLVLEDLDGLFDEEGLAFFLNELDGFSENHGIVTLGTTNHPERLDPALLDRPSRFDRTYAFALPTLEDRRAFLELQASRLAGGLTLSPAVVDEIAAGSDGFSFAYLKELIVSALLLVVGGNALSFEETVRANLPKLTEQLGRARAVAASKPKV